MNLICFIFARGGSKELKNKNIKKFNNKPLIANSILNAKKIKIIKGVFVSTDSKKIKKISENYGAKVPFLRPKILAKDNSPELLSWKHAINFYEKKFNKKIDIFISLPTTSPLTKKNDIIKAINIFLKKRKQIDLLISITKTNHYPGFNMVNKNKKKIVKILKGEKNIYQRQKIKNIFNISTCFYITTPQYIRKCRKNLFKGKIYGYEVDKYSAIDIDTIYDFKFAEFLKKHGE